MNRLKQDFLVIKSNGKTQLISLTGRVAWAMAQLVNAGKEGCTPINNPAPRWSGYIHNIRKEYPFINVETVTELHGGQFAGSHARYVLHTKIVPSSKLEDA